MIFLADYVLCFLTADRAEPPFALFTRELLHTHSWTVNLCIKVGKNYRASHFFYLQFNAEGYLDDSVQQILAVQGGAIIPHLSRN